MINRIEIHLPEDSSLEIRDAANYLFDEHFKKFNNIDQVAFLYFDSKEIIITGDIEEQAKEGFELLIGGEDEIHRKISFIESEIEELDESIADAQKQIENLEEEIEDFENEKNDKQKLIDRYEKIL